MQRRKLVEFATTLFKLTGTDTLLAARQAADVLKLETALAASHLKPAELRDPIKNYNKKSLAELEKLAPNIGWSNVFSTFGVNTDSVNIGQPKYFSALSTLLASQPLDVWKSKMKFEYINSNAGALS